VKEVEGMEGVIVIALVLLVVVFVVNPKRR
jgi:hypothetical protein